MIPGLCQHTINCGPKHSFILYPQVTLVELSGCPNLPLFFAGKGKILDFWAHNALWAYSSRIIKDSLGFFNDASDPLVVTDPLVFSAFDGSSRVCDRGRSTESGAIICTTFSGSCKACEQGRERGENKYTSLVSRMKRIQTF